MVINKEQLILLLVEKTGLEQEQVEAQLSELVDRIQKAAKDGKTFQIEGFGTFRMEDGNLKFDPNDTLQTEINNKYAGMKPIELIGAFKEPNGDDIPDVDAGDQTPESDDAVWAFDEEAEEDDSEEVAEEAVEEPVTAEEENETVEAEKQQEEVEAEDADEEEAFVAELQNESQEEVIEKALEPAAKPQQITEETEQEADPIGKVLLVAVMVIVIGVAGWFIYDMGLMGGTNTNTDGQTFSDQRVHAQQDISENVSTQHAKDTQQDSTANVAGVSQSKNSEPEQKKEVTKQGGARSAPSVEDEHPYGLRGEVNHSISSGYTIVVHSLRSMKKAEGRKQNLLEQGFRVMISQAQVNGETYFRVGVGQFPTVKAAQQAIEKLPEPYKSNNFIKRIK